MPTISCETPTGYGPGSTLVFPRVKLRTLVWSPRLPCALLSQPHLIVEGLTLVLFRSACVLRPLSKVLTQFLDPYLSIGVHRHLYLPVLTFLAYGAFRFHLDRGLDERNRTLLLSL